MTSFFSADGGPIWIKNSETGAKCHVDCGDMVKIETKCRIPIWRTFGRIQWHVIPEPRITLHGTATWWIHCHDSRAACHTVGCSHLTKSMSWSCHIAGCKNSIRHIENRFSPYFILFCFNAAWAMTSSSFRIVSDTFVTKSIGHRQVFLFSDLAYFMHLLYLVKLSN